MGICNSVTSSKQKGPLKEVQTLSTGRSALDSKRTATIYHAGEQFFIKGTSDNNALNGDTLREKVELSLALKNLPIGDAIYRVEVFLSPDVSKIQYTSVGVTEEIQRDTDVINAFNMSFFFDYYFERDQLFKFTIFKNNERITESITVGKIMGSRNLSYEINLPQLTTIQDEPVTLIIKANKKASSNPLNALFNISVMLELNQTMHQFPLFYIISRKNNDGNWKKVYKSDEHSVRPGIQSFMNKLQIYHNSLVTDRKTTTHQELSLEFFNPINMTSIGIAYVDLFSLKKSPSELNHIAIRDVNGDEIGTLFIGYNEEEIMTFVDYLKNGIDINLIVAIDYTASNGYPNEPNSLHYVQGLVQNNYEKAVLSCGKIVAYYDKNQLFPVYGFGGIPYGMTSVQHCFPINGQQDNRISSIDNIATVYHQSLFTTKLSGPTYFCPVIQRVLDQIKAERSQTENRYYILLLLTDGQINDMNETCDLIVEASTYPLSIIIIGIGNADFSSMTTLDGDDIPLTSSNGEVRKRDLVQFVCFNDFKDSCVNNASALAAAVLEEIPKQVDDYYKLTHSFIKKAI